MIVYKMSKMTFLIYRSKLILLSEVQTIFVSVTDIFQQADKFHGSPVTNGSKSVFFLYRLSSCYWIISEFFLRESSRVSIIRLSNQDNIIISIFLITILTLHLPLK